MGPGGQAINDPTGTPGTQWAAAIQSSQPTGMAPTSFDDPLLAQVFMGMGIRGGGAADDTPRGYGSSGAAVPTASTTSIEQLLQQFEQMDRRQQRQLALLLTIGGYAGSMSLDEAGAAARDLTLNETLNAYLELLDDAAGRYLRGQKITPEQLLEQNVAYRLPRNANWDGSYGDLVDVLGENDIDVSGVDEPDKAKDLSGTHTTTSTNTSVNRDVMEPNDAMALTRAMLQRELGRDPTKAEFEDFVGAVQAAQRSNPERTTSKSTNTVTTNKKGRVVDSDTSSSSTRTGGITQAGVEDLMLRRARQNPDWAEWQAVGTYAPALFQALGATVPGV